MYSRRPPSSPIMPLSRHLLTISIIITPGWLLCAMGRKKVCGALDALLLLTFQHIPNPRHTEGTRWWLHNEFIGFSVFYEFRFQWPLLPTDSETASWKPKHCISTIEGREPKGRERVSSRSAKRALSL